MGMLKRVHPALVLTLVMELLMGILECVNPALVVRVKALPLQFGKSSSSSRSWSCVSASSERDNPHNFGAQRRAMVLISARRCLGGLTAGGRCKPKQGVTNEITNSQSNHETFRVSVPRLYVLLRFF
ncbi:hypothetical protein GOP47_0011094 [Adiantum capillus-veneris]|uniref:Uncharacterized protein n=1 Tax=Adiantum capillus-veneris TaxID=13818 RepID=A0A9D4USM4_ADICA|nr:hypothetical protein GOP47_0011094 [Adiantum capillus-veneris]